MSFFKSVADKIKKFGKWIKDKFLAIKNSRILNNRYFKIFIWGRNSVISLIISLIIGIIAPIYAYKMMESFVNRYTDMTEEILIFNLIFVFLVEIALLLLTKSLKIASFFTVLMCAVIGYAECMVLSFRSLPIYPWDLLSIRTALSVAGEYELQITEHIRLLLRYYAYLLAVILLFCWAKIPKFKLSLVSRIAGLLVVALCFTIWGAKAQDEDFQEDIGYYPYLFTPTVVYRENGFFFSFISLLKYVNVEEPKGYDVEELQRTADKYSSMTADGPKGDIPNIIVIMNESFSDLSVLGDIEINMDFMPYFRSIKDNAISGYAYTSVKGGNTPNSEYEFLLGDTMAFLPSGSIPYQQYIKEDMDGFISDLKENGYSSIAIHPYNATGWQRDTIYPMLGFDSALFSRDFLNPERIRSYISDGEVFDKIKRIFADSTNGDTPLSVFAVTMQNHGGYVKPAEGFYNFEPDVDIAGMPYNKSLVQAYLSLVKISDEEFASFLEFFSYQPDNTVILMFGDHQPNSSVTKPILDSLGVDEETDDWNERSRQFIVPFVIWANYDIEEQSDVVTSLNYLNIYLSEAAGLPLSGYQQYRKELMVKYPVITANFCIDAEGNILTWDKLDIESDKDLLLYSQFQYNHLFDENKLVGFFD